jgi:hypothetical protein
MHQENQSSIFLFFLRLQGLGGIPGRLVAKEGNPGL